MTVTPAPEQPLIFLLGPTASGKTAAAIELVERLPLEIISVDSAMVYRGMDVGTAKPSAAELARAPHRLIDLVEPEEAYSAARFCTDASREIDAIRRQGRVPLLVGGTMLYFRALSQGLSRLPAADPEVRARLAAAAERDGWEALHRRLARIDPVAAQRIHPNDPQRIQRALEVWELTGQPLSQLQTGAARIEPLPALRLALEPADRGALHRRIEQRFKSMLQCGLIEEVAALRRRPELSPELPSIRAVGYRQVWQYLAGELCYDSMLQRGIVATRQLAKRQLTWMRSEVGLDRFASDPLDRSALYDRVARYLEAHL